jgi:hypothetical protein
VHGLRERAVLGQEAVAGMHGVGTGPPRRVDEEVAPQIGLGGGVAGQADRVIGLGHVRRVGIGVGVDRDGLHPDRPAGDDDAAGDLATVRHQQSSDHALWTSHHIRKTPKPGRALS